MPSFCNNITGSQSIVASKEQLKQQYQICKLTPAFEQEFVKIKLEKLVSQCFVEKQLVSREHMKY